MIDELELVSQATAPLGQRDIERLERARSVLLERMVSPPGLPELARYVGLNEVKLKVGFRTVFGDSVFGYLRAQRMEAARRLLAEREAGVAEVAVRVGYSNPSKFAAAFRKHRLPAVRVALTRDRSCSRVEPPCSGAERKNGTALAILAAMSFRTTRFLARVLTSLSALTVLHTDRAAAKPVADDKVVAIATSLVTPIFGAYYAEVDARASRSLSVLVNFSYLALEHDAWKTKTGTVGAGVRYHWQGTALRRWYVEANSELMLSSWRHEPSGKVASITPGVSGTAIVGYRFVWDLGPVLDVGAGVVALHFPSARVDTDAGPVSFAAFTNVYPALKVHVGWAF